MTEENHEKTLVRLVGTGIRTRDLPNASLVRYHGATSLGECNIVSVTMLLAKWAGEAANEVLLSVVWNPLLIEINLSN